MRLVAAKDLDAERARAAREIDARAGRLRALFESFEPGAALEHQEKFAEARRFLDDPRSAAAKERAPEREFPFLSADARVDGGDRLAAAQRIVERRERLVRALAAISELRRRAKSALVAAAGPGEMRRLAESVSEAGLAALAPDLADAG